MSQYKNLRHFIFLNVKAEYRSEGYRLVRKLLEEGIEVGRQRAALGARLGIRMETPTSFDDCGVPAFEEGE